MVWFIAVCLIVVMFPFVFIIWLLVLPFDKERYLIHMIISYQCFLFASAIPIWKLKIENKKKIKKGTTYVIISNHQSILDILIINCLIIRFKWVSKIENIKVPFLGWYLLMANYIVVDRSDEESKTAMLEKSYALLKKGISLMIFPEGTRSLDNQIGFFKRGAFQLALQTNVAILPVLIDGTGDVLPKKGLIFGRGHSIRLKVLDPVSPIDFGTTDHEVLASKLKTMMEDELRILRSK